jgi:carboxylate-amine ligase
VVSVPLESFDDVLAAILTGRREAASAARAVGARAVALATSPVPFHSHLVPGNRYARMQEQFGITMDEQFTCGFHVHVSVGSEAEGVAVLDRIRPWLPVVLALSCNSPFWNGIDTGYASYRYQAWGRWPSAGAYDVFGSPELYHQRLIDMVATEVSMDEGMVYFDARLSRHAPTVETRIADVCLRPREAAVLAVLVRALVETAAMGWMAGTPAHAIPTALLRLASWRASRSGLEGSLIHPEKGTPVPAATAVLALLDHVADHFAGRDEELFVRESIQTSLRDGSGAKLQRAVMTSRGSFAAVIESAAHESLLG